MAVVQEGTESLTCCDLCRMHMPVGKLIKYWQNQIYDMDTQMRWRRRVVVIPTQCTEATFSLTGEDGAEKVEGVDVFKYMGWPLDR